MNWNFSAWAIRNPVPPILLFIVLVVLGLMSFSKLPVTRFPNIDMPLVSVTVTDPGVAPSELETQVTKRVEDAVANITGVKNVTSTMTEGQSQTVIEFRLEVDTQTAVNDVKDAVERIRSDLPATSEEPIVNRVDVEGQAILTYAVSAPAMTIEELSWFVDDTVIRKLQGLKGVARVDRYGGVTREIKVELDPDRLNALGVTAGDVNRALRAANVDLTGGSGDFGEPRPVDPHARRRQEDRRSRRRWKSRSAAAASVTLSEIATVTDSWEKPKSFARVNNQTVVSFGIFRGKGESDVEVSRPRRGRGRRPAERSIRAWRSARSTIRSQYTEGNYNSAMETLIEGAVLSVIVVLIFLRDIRATLVSAIALPLSIIPTFWALDMMGFSLNLVSLLGITLVVGILVDDAIVEIENIVRHIKMGKSPYRAALEAADEIGLAVIAISATIMAVFAPVSFMGGIAGQYFKQFGLTVAVAVFFSLLVARLLTPMLAAYFLRGHGHAEPKPGIVMRGYERAAEGDAALPLADARCRHRLLRRLDLRHGLPAVGLHPARGCQPHHLLAGTAARQPARGHARHHRRGDQADARGARGRERLCHRRLQPAGHARAAPRDGHRRPDAQVGARRARRPRSRRSCSTSWTPSPTCAPISSTTAASGQLAFGVMGTDGAVLDKQARKIQSEMNGDRQVPRGLVQRRARPAGGHHRARSRAARRARHLDGDAVGDAARRDDRRHRRQPRQIHRRRPPDPDPRAAQREGARTTFPSSAQLPVPTRVGRLGAAVVGRRGPLRPGPVLDRSASTASAASSSAPTWRRAPSSARASRRVWGLPAVKNMPAGTRIQETGDAEIMGEVFAGFATAMGTGLMLVLVVLILLFGSVFHSFTILGSLPLAIGGVVAGADG